MVDDYWQVYQDYIKGIESLGLPPMPYEEFLFKQYGIGADPGVTQGEPKHPKDMTYDEMVAAPIETFGSLDAKYLYISIYHPDRAIYWFHTVEGENYLLANGKWSGDRKEVTLVDDTVIGADKNEYGEWEFWNLAEGQSQAAEDGPTKDREFYGAIGSGTAWINPDGTFEDDDGNTISAQDAELIRNDWLSSFDEEADKKSLLKDGYEILERLDATRDIVKHTETGNQYVFDSETGNYAPYSPPDDPNANVPMPTLGQGETINVDTFVVTRPDGSQVIWDGAQGDWLSVTPDPSKTGDAGPTGISGDYTYIGDTENGVPLYQDASGNTFVYDSISDGMVSTTTGLPTDEDTFKPGDPDPTTGLTPPEQASIDLQREQLAQQAAELARQAQQEQDQMKLEYSKYLAGLAASPAAFMEYAVATGQQAAVQPWMQGDLDPTGQLQAGQGLPGWGPGANGQQPIGRDWQGFGGGAGGGAGPAGPGSQFGADDGWEEISTGGSNQTGGLPYNPATEQTMNTSYRDTLNQVISQRYPGMTYMSPEWNAQLTMQQKYALTQEAERLTRGQYAQTTGEQYPTYPGQESDVGGLQNIKNLPPKPPEVPDPEEQALEDYYA